MNFLQDPTKCERYIRDDVSRFGKVETYQRIYNDFGFVDDKGLLQITHKNVDIVLCTDQLVVTTWPKICCTPLAMPDLVKTYDAKNYPLLVGFFEYYTAQ